jgi:hypothetical protein
LALFCLTFFIDSIFAKINHSKFLLFVDGLKICRNMKIAEDYKALQIHVDAVQQWRGENGIGLNIQKLESYLNA